MCAATSREENSLLFLLECSSPRYTHSHLVRSPKFVLKSYLLSEALIGCPIYNFLSSPIPLFLLNFFLFIIFHFLIHCMLYILILFVTHFCHWNVDSTVAGSFVVFFRFALSAPRRVPGTSQVLNKLKEWIITIIKKKKILSTYTDNSASWCTLLIIFSKPFNSSTTMIKCWHSKW